MDYKQDTIVAISTPPGIGGIAVIRVSGGNAIPCVEKIFNSSHKFSRYPSHKAIFGKIKSGKQVIDEVIVTKFIAPHSYTGEDVVEISCHGSVFIANKILELLLVDCRLAEKGEFTQRAFFNDKLGLTQAEAVGDLLQAKTKFSHLAALKQYEGRLRNRIENYLGKIIELRTQFELEIDFSEQGLEKLDRQKTENEISSLIAEIQELVDSGEEGLILRDGLKVSLVGAPNVGKSSIFNRLLQTSRAIVTPHPGTTRDYLEEAIALQGYFLKVFDTAGLRQTENQIEKIGIARSYQIITNSHKILFIIDGDENLDEYQKLTQIVDKERIIKVLNKSDIFSRKEIENFRKKGYVVCSATSKNGLQELKEKLLTDIQISEEFLQEGILTNLRQILAGKRAIKALQAALDSFKNKLGLEFTAFDLKSASEALEEIIGKITSEKILEQIFDNFCVGK